MTTASIGNRAAQARLGEITRARPAQRSRTLAATAIVRCPAELRHTPVGRLLSACRELDAVALEACLREGAAVWAQPLRDLDPDQRRAVAEALRRIRPAPAPQLALFGRRAS